MIFESNNNWSNIITESYGITDANKLSWMSKYAQIHEAVESNRSTNLFEAADVNSVQGAQLFATPFNTLGMGNPHLPYGVGVNPSGTGSGIGNTGADFHNPAYQTGSDVPISTLTMALEVAAVTIGLELVPVVPASGPYALLTFMDTPYAGGKMGTDWETTFDGKSGNFPKYIKISGDLDKLDAIKAKYAKGDEVTITFAGNTLVAKYIGNSRIYNEAIIEPITVTVDSQDGSIAQFFKGADKADSDAVMFGDLELTGVVRPELVSNVADHIQGFSNFFDGSEDPMTRAQNETGVGNTIGIRHFTKMIQMGSYEVTGSVTRQQLQDLPIYGVNAIGSILQAMQNQISQEINNRILDRLFRLGVTNAINLAHTQPGSNMNLYLSNTLDGKEFNTFSYYNKYVGIHGEKANFGTITPANSITGGETFISNQRRIASRIMAAANLVTQSSRHGRPNWIVTNTQVLSALQDNANFVVAPVTNTLTQDGSQSIYFAGSIAGMNVYVDPYMAWDDTRILVGKKANVTAAGVSDPGVVFMPYILADTVQTIDEGTMAPKHLVNSRFAIVDAGFYPEQNYYCFGVETNGMGII